MDDKDKTAPIPARSFFILTGRGDSYRWPIEAPVTASVAIVPAKSKPIPSGGPWRVEPIWPGPIFVVAGGPSVVNINLELIRGRRVIAVNSSYEAVPWADIVYFGDGRWWESHKKKLVGLKSHLVTVSGIVNHPRLLKLKRIKPAGDSTGFAVSPDSLASQRTSLQGAMNLAAHLGGNPIVLIGADMGRAADGRSHHHTPHKWKNRPGNGTWDDQMRHLRWIVEPLKKRNIAVINCSLTSRIGWWPKMTLEEYLATEKAK